VSRMLTLNEIMPKNHVENAGAYHCSVLARKFVKVDRVGPTLIARAILLVGRVEDVEVVVSDVLALYGIGNEFHE